MKSDLQPDIFKLSEFLSQHAKSLKGRPKRVRTRAKILAATAFEMERVGYDALTVDGIVDIADMARGTFYLYFENRAEVAVAVMRRYSALMRRSRPRRLSGLSRFQAIHRYNRYYVALYSTNAALLAGREALMREAPEVLKQRDWINARWTRIVLRDLSRRMDFPKQLLIDPIASLIIRSAIAMVDELLREIYVYKSPSLAKIVENDEQVAEIISLVWYRIIYGDTPLPHELKTTADFASLFENVGGILDRLSVKSA